jgi:hypothetical protein
MASKSGRSYLARMKPQNHGFSTSKAGPASDQKDVRCPMRCLLGCFFCCWGGWTFSAAARRCCGGDAAASPSGCCWACLKGKKGIWPADACCCRRLKQRRPAAAAAGRAIGERRLLLGRGGGFADGGVPAPLPNGFAFLFPIPVAFLGRCFPGAPPPPSNLLSSPHHEASGAAAPAGP